MWYASSMTQHQVEPGLKEAHAAIRHARDTRSFHARRTKKGSKQREDDLESARARLKRAMVPLRSFTGAAPSRPQTEAHTELWARVAAASKELQSERRKLWKMMERKKAEK